MITVLGQRSLTDSAHILALRCGLGKGFRVLFGKKALTVTCLQCFGRAGRNGGGGQEPAPYASSRIVTEDIATGLSGRSREFRGAFAIWSTTSRPLVTSPKIV